MKKIFLFTALAMALGAGAQNKEKVQAEKGVIYGVVAEDKTAVAVDDLKDKLVDNQYVGQITAKVVEVCQAEGCWIKVQRKDGSAMLVRAKDHAFLMPSNIVGRKVLIDGSATMKETTEAQRRHYAEDAGKSKEQIEAIRGSEIAVEFSAKGVKVLD